MRRPTNWCFSEMALALALIVGAPTRGVATEVPAEPRITLWSWAGPEDLRFVDPKQVGVAFLAGTIVVHSDSVESRQRRRELQVTAGTRLTAVVRVETASRGASIITAAQQQRIVEDVFALANGPGVSELQLDFAARVPERTLCRELLMELRRRLRPQMRLSMTALASWCLGDPWISGLPVDRAVPMILRMGTNEGRVRTHLASGTRFASSLCREDIGISTDEPFPKLPASSWAKKTPYWYR